MLRKTLTRPLLRNFQTRNVTGVVLMNMGGPTNPEDTKPFLTNLFSDPDIIELGGGIVQKMFCNFLVSRRAPKVAKKYEEIGGSPITKWHEYQAEKLQQKLDEECKESAPHKVYVAFRYTPPFTQDVLKQMKADGVKHAIAFPTYPQWSCTTSGSSMNELWRNLESLELEKEFKWSVIDRWFNNPTYHETQLERIVEKMETYPAEIRNEVTILFSAHSLPMKVVAKGDQYVMEIGATAKTIMNKLPEYLKKKGISGWTGKNPHYVTWQSKVGPLPWMVPKTEEVIKGLGKRGVKNVLCVPVAFVCDHIETLHEIGIEYLEEAEKAGVSGLKFTEGFNDSEKYTETLTELVKEHLESKTLHSENYKLKCIGCEKPYCRRLPNPAF